MLYKINMTRMLWGAQNSLPLDKPMRSVPMELLVFLLVTMIVSLCQSFVMSIVQVPLMLADPEYYTLISNPEVSADEITEYSIRFTQSLPAWVNAVLLASSAFMIIAALFYCKKFEKRKAYTLGFTARGCLTEYLGGLGIGAVMISLPILACLATKCVSFSLTKSIDPLMIAIYFAAFLIQGMGEEALFRGYLMTSLARKKNIWLAIIVSSLMFSVFHIGNSAFSFIAFINIFLFGIFASVLMLKRGSIWAIGAIHAIWNFAQGNIFGFNVSGNNMGSSLLTATQNNFGQILSGGEFGPEGGLGVTVVMLVAILGSLMISTKKSEYVPDDDEDEEKASKAEM